MSGVETFTPRKIAVVTPLPVSGEEGGNERHWRSLTAALVEAGHEAELIGVVSPENDLLEVLASYAMFRAMDLSHFDVVISGKYPSFMVRHPRHIRHLNHPLRGLYEHYPAGLPLDLPPDLRAGIDACGDDVDRLVDWASGQCVERPNDPSMTFPGPFARAVVHRLDRIGRDHLIAEAAVSETVANRPNYVDPTRPITIIPPLGDLEIADEPTVVHGAGHAPARPFLFTFGRLDRAKRFELIIRSFRAAKRLPGMGELELVVAGGGPLADELKALADNGVRVVGRLPDDELTAHLRQARAVVLTPIDEDYGLVAAEAMAAGTPVITTSDSGGIAEQVEHGRTGLVVHPKPALLARAMRSIAIDADRAARMGRAAADAVRPLSWQPMLDLVADVADDVDRHPVLLVSTFPAEAVESGGQRRLRGMATGLRSHGFAPTILSLTNRVGPGQIRRRRTADGVIHISVGRSAAHLEADFAMTSLLGSPVDDVAASVLWPASPVFQTVLESEVGRADAVIASHPFLASALPKECGPLVYDAFNVETDLKASLFDLREGGAWVADLAAESEADTIARSQAVSATSAADLLRFEALGLINADLPIVVAPNPLDAAVVEPRTDDERRSARNRFLADHSLAGDERPIALFIGSDHPPNRVAADLCHRLAEERPDLHVVIGGTVRSSGGPATEVGSFPIVDLRRLHVMADVVLNPIETGSGTSLKLIDPLSLGIPVVATRIGARGLSSPDDIVWLTEADPTSIGEAIDLVVGDPATAERRCEAGKAAAAGATPANATAELAGVLWELLNQHAR